MEEGRTQKVPNYMEGPPATMSDGVPCIVRLADGREYESHCRSDRPWTQKANSYRRGGNWPTVCEDNPYSLDVPAVKISPRRVRRCWATANTQKCDQLADQAHHLQLVSWHDAPSPTRRLLLCRKWVRGPACGTPSLRISSLPLLL